MRERERAERGRERGWNNANKLNENNISTLIPYGSNVQLMKSNIKTQKEKPFITLAS